MAANAPAEDDARFAVKVTADSHFAWFRTRLALERTIMAWVRTSVALIGFGFTIVQFFERLNSMEGVVPGRHPFATRYVGLVLIGAGVFALVTSVWQYHAVVKYLWRGDFAAIAGVGRAPGHSPVYAIAIVMTFIGVFAFLVVLLRAV
jgi:putative membrane protein